MKNQQYHMTKTINDKMINNNIQNTKPKTEDVKQSKPLTTYFNDFLGCEKFY